MGYFNNVWKKPAKKAASRWKMLLMTTAAESLFIVFVFLILWGIKFALMGSLVALDQQNLDDVNVLMENADRYTSEIKSFITMSISSSIIGLIVFFILYTITRTLIWSWILKVKKTYIRNANIDFVFFVAVIAIITFCILFIKQVYYGYILMPTIIPLMYYSFHCHMRLGSKSIKEVFKKAVSYKLLLMLPHTILLLLLVSLINLAGSNIFILVLQLIALNWFRLFAIEI
jgi:hypothetical protein